MVAVVTGRCAQPVVRALSRSRRSTEATFDKRDTSRSRLARRASSTVLTQPAPPRAGAGTSSALAVELVRCSKWPCRAPAAREGAHHRPSAASDDNGNHCKALKVLSLLTCFAPAKKVSRPRGRNPRQQAQANPRQTISLYRPQTQTQSRPQSQSQKQKQKQKQSQTQTQQQQQPLST